MQFLRKEELLFKVDQTFLKITETPKIITSILSGQTIVQVDVCMINRFFNKWKLNV